MGLTRNLNSPKSVANRRQFLNKIGILSDHTARAQLVHGARIGKVARIPSAGFVKSADALITSRPNTFLYILSADCFPVFFYDTTGRTVGIAHAGWRGVVKNIVPKVIRALKTQYAASPKNIRVVIGPGIQKCHFEIWPQTRHKGITPHLKSYKQFLHQRGRRLFWDLEGIIRYQLQKSGIPAKNIRTVRECTYCIQRKYFSYRRDADSRHPRGLGNMLSVIGYLQKYPRPRRVGKELE